METMYPAMINSPKTELLEAITESDTTISVVDITKLPAAPNIFTILSGDISETISYESVTNNKLTGCKRGLNGTAKSWNAGIKVARTYTAYDHDSMIQNIKELIKKTVEASITQKGLVQLSDAITSTETTKAATANAVKKSIDTSSADATTKAATAEKNAKESSLPISGGQLSGSLLIYGSEKDLSISNTASNKTFRLAQGGDGNIYLQRRNIDGTNNEQLLIFDTTGAIKLKSGVLIITGTGNPEGAINGTVGSLYLRSDGTTGTSLYVKESGIGNSGWKAK